MIRVLKHKKELEVVSLFSGIGAFEKSLERLGVPFKLKAFSEIDKWASTSYSAIHRVSEDKNMWDITKSNPKDVPNCDMITHGSPCQDFSVAGKGKGGNKDTGTRSSLMWYTVKIVEEKLPKYVVWENVKGVLSAKHKHNFDKYLTELENLGYNNYHKILNAKDYGIPQNRERIFVISIRKDIDDYTFSFPEPFDSGLRLRHLLEDYVDEKYYINNERCEKLLEELKNKEISNTVRTGGRGSTDRHQWDLIVDAVKSKNQDISYCIDANYFKGTTPADFLRKSRRQLVCVPDKTIQINNPNHFSARAYSKESIAPTISAGNNGGKEPCKILCKLQENPETNGDSESNNLLVIGNTVPSGHTAGIIFNTDGISPTVMYRNSKVVQVLEENHPNELLFIGGIGNKDWAGDGKELSRNFPQGNRVYDSDGIACSQTSQGGGIGSFTGLYLESKEIRPCLTPDRIPKRQQGRRFKDSNEPMFTITAQDRHGILIMVLKDNLILEPNECRHIFDIPSDILNDNERQRRVYSEDGVSPTILARSDNAKILKVGMLDMKGSEQVRRVYNPEGICPTLDTMGGGHREPKIIIDKSIKPSVAKNFEREKEKIAESDKEIYQCKCDSGWQDNKVGLTVSPTIRAGNSHTSTLDNEYRIRKLTPLECWRLMGFDDEDYFVAKKALEDKYYNGSDRSNSQMYKQAGNSIVVNVLEEILKSLLFKDA